MKNKINTVTRKGKKTTFRFLLVAVVIFSMFCGSVSALTPAERLYLDDKEMNKGGGLLSFLGGSDEQARRVCGIVPGKDNTNCNPCQSDEIPVDYSCFQVDANDNICDKSLFFSNSQYGCGVTCRCIKANNPVVNTNIPPLFFLATYTNLNVCKSTMTYGSYPSGCVNLATQCGWNSGYCCPAADFLGCAGTGVTTTSTTLAGGGGGGVTTTTIRTTTTTQPSTTKTCTAWGQTVPNGGHFCSSLGNYYVCDAYGHSTPVMEVMQDCAANGGTCSSVGQSGVCTVGGVTTTTIAGQTTTTVPGQTTTTTIPAGGCPSGQSKCASGCCDNDCIVGGIWPNTQEVQTLWHCKDAKTSIKCGPTPTGIKAAKFDCNTCDFSTGQCVGVTSETGNGYLSGAVYFGTPSNKPAVLYINKGEKITVSAKFTATQTGWVVIAADLAQESTTFNIANPANAFTIQSNVCDGSNDPRYASEFVLVTAGKSYDITFIMTPQTEGTYGVAVSAWDSCYPVTTRKKVAYAYSANKLIVYPVDRSIPTTTLPYIGEKGTTTPITGYLQQCEISPDDARMWNCPAGYTRVMAETPYCTQGTQTTNAIKDCPSEYKKQVPVYGNAVPTCSANYVWDAASQTCYLKGAGASTTYTDTFNANCYMGEDCCGSGYVLISVVSSGPCPLTGYLGWMCQDVVCKKIAQVTTQTTQTTATTLPVGVVAPSTTVPQQGTPAKDPRNPLIPPCSIDAPNCGWFGCGDCPSGYTLQYYSDITTWNPLDSIGICQPTVPTTNCGGGGVVIPSTSTTTTMPGSTSTTSTTLPVQPVTLDCLQGCVGKGSGASCTCGGVATGVCTMQTGGVCTKIPMWVCKDSGARVDALSKCGAGGGRVTTPDTKCQDVLNCALPAIEGSKCTAETKGQKCTWKCGTGGVQCAWTTLTKTYYGNCMQKSGGTWVCGLDSGDGIMHYSDGSKSNQAAPVTCTKSSDCSSGYTCTGGRCVYTGGGSNNNDNDEDNGGGSTPSTQDKCTYTGFKCKDDNNLLKCQDIGKGYKEELTLPCVTGSKCVDGDCAIDTSRIPTTTVLTTQDQCIRGGGTWNSATSTCSWAYMPVPMPAPFLNTYWWVVLLVVTFIIFGVTAYLIRAKIIKKKSLPRPFRSIRF